jgi:hypothetical protein
MEEESEKQISSFLALGDSMPNENVFQALVIIELRNLFPGCIILKNDPNYLQGFPDLTILFGKHWATLETKKSEDAPRQPNQEYYVELCWDMSYSAFICPENKELVYDELQQAFRPRRASRISRSK